MAYKKAAKATLTDLDCATKEYESLFETVKDTYSVWDSSKDSALNVITDVESLAGSISHTPFTINRKVKSLSVQKENYKSRETIEREKRRDDLAASAGAVAVIGAGAAAALSFCDYVKDTFFKKFGVKLGKNYILWLVFAVILLLAILLLWVGWTIARKREAMKASQNTKALRKEIDSLQRKEATVKVLITEISEQTEIVAQKLISLQQFAGMRYRDLSKDVQEDLVAMVNDAVALSELISRGTD